MDRGTNVNFNNRTVVGMYISELQIPLTSMEITTSTGGPLGAPLIRGPIILMKIKKGLKNTLSISIMEACQLLPLRKQIRSRRKFQTSSVSLENGDLLQASDTPRDSDDHRIHWRQHRRRVDDAD